MAEYTPSDSEEWELVDLLAAIIEDVNDEPQFTVSEHALMAAGTIRREWLAAHDARIRRDAAREALSGLVEQERELHSRDQAVYAECGHAAGAAVMYRDTHYPEEAPDA